MSTAQTPDLTHDAYLAEIERVTSQLTEGALAPTAELRRAAADHLATNGFPKPREEAWRFFNLRPLLKSVFNAPQPVDDALAAEAKTLFTFEGLDGLRLVFINGEFSEKLSSIGNLPKGARISSLRQALASNPDEVTAHLGKFVTPDMTPFTALNTALFSDGAYIALDGGVVIDQPIHVLNLTVGESRAMTSPRLLVVLAENAEAKIIESYASHATGEHFTNAVTEFDLADGAHAEHIKLQRESEEAFHVAAIRFHQGRDSNVFSNNITLGSLMTRNDIGSRIDDEGAHCALDGLNLVAGSQWVDNHTLLDHAKPNCTSHQLYKSVLDDKATTVFNGRIIVRQDAQKTDAIQSNHSMLLSDKATAHTQPNLEIFADDVKCTHGATIGNVDDSRIFYLRSRGISEEEARAMLTFAFANEIIDEIKIEPVRQQLEQFVYARFNRQRGDA